MRKVAKSIKETNEIARLFVNKILQDKDKQLGAMVVCLSGDLGAGKTAFTKAVAKHLGIKNTVNSPTFVIIKKYLVKLKRHKYFFHLDAYRLKNEKELLHLGWQEIINDKYNLVFIEWPENVSKAIPSHARFVYISINKNGHRNFKLK